MRRWERLISGLAVQEMTHLALVSNLLLAIGGAPHFARPNLPQRSRYYPQDVQLSLEPFSAATIRHFVYLERPEGMDVEDSPVFTPPARTAVPWHAPGRIIPRGQQFATVGHLYRGIGIAFTQLVETFRRTVGLHRPRVSSGDAGRLRLPRADADHGPAHRRCTRSGRSWRRARAPGVTGPTPTTAASFRS